MAGLGAGEEGAHGQGTTLSLFIYVAAAVILIALPIELLVRAVKASLDTGAGPPNRGGIVLLSLLFWMALLLGIGLVLVGAQKQQL